MLANGFVALLCALILFSMFAINVALGATGNGALIDDLGEMLMLLASTLFFVVGVLQREARAKSTQR